MKKTSILILISLLANIAFSQNIEKSIKKIRKQFQWVNSQKDYKKEELNNKDFLDHTTDNGATLTGFFKDEKLYKITEVVAISYAYFKTDYYFWDNKLFFVYRTEHQYKEKKDAQGNFVEMDYTKTDIKYQDRQYFENGKQIRRIEKGKLISAKKNYPKNYIKLANKRKDAIVNKYKYRDKYKKIQGTWKSTDSKRILVYDGLIRTTYYGEEYIETCRIKFSEEKLYIKSFEDKKNTEYETPVFNDKTLTLIETLSGYKTSYKKK